MRHLNGCMVRDALDNSYNLSIDNAFWDLGVTSRGTASSADMVTQRKRWRPNVIFRIKTSTPQEMQVRRLPYNPSDRLVSFDIPGAGVMGHAFMSESTVIDKFLNPLLKEAMKKPLQISNIFTKGANTLANLSTEKDIKAIKTAYKYLTENPESADFHKISEHSDRAVEAMGMERSNYTSGRDVLLRECMSAIIVTQMHDKMPLKFVSLFQRSALEHGFDNLDDPENDSSTAPGSEFRMRGQKLLEASVLFPNSEYKDDMLKTAWTLRCR